MKIRTATYGDVPRILGICEEAKCIMRSDGNFKQWTDGYPEEEVIRKDIDRGVGYIIEDTGKAEAYFAFIPGIEETYLKIEGGQWLNDKEAYGTIHRLASSKSSHGIAEACFNWCWDRMPNLRIDTHKDNRIMQHCIDKFGFVFCGIIYLRNGDPRLAFQKIGQRP